MKRVWLKVDVTHKTLDRMDGETLKEFRYRADHEVSRIVHQALAGDNRLAVNLVSFQSFIPR